MNISQRPSGLLVAKDNATVEAEERERYRQMTEAYRRDHAVCPLCGSTSISQTCVGSIRLPGHGPCDDFNRAICHTCDWRGVVHDLVPAPGLLQDNCCLPEKDDVAVG